MMAEHNIKVHAFQELCCIRMKRSVVETSLDSVLLSSSDDKKTKSSDEDRKSRNPAKRMFLKKDNDFLADSDYCSKSSYGSNRLRDDDVRKALMENLSQSEDEEEGETTNSESEDVDLVSSEEEKLKKSVKNNSCDNQTSWSDRSDLSEAFKPKKKKKLLNKVAPKKDTKIIKKSLPVRNVRNSKKNDTDNADSTDGSDVEVRSPTRKNEKNEPVTKKEILDFFNNDSVTSFRSIMNKKFNIMNNKKWSVLENLRPFTDFDDLYRKLKVTKEEKLGGLVILSNITEGLEARKTINKLLDNCKQISKEIKRKVDGIMAHDRTEDNASNESYYKLKPQPAVLNKKFTLKSYQIVGLNWLILMNQEGLNSILADEMGLGKTCQTIAFLAYLYEQNESLVHLIVVPASTLENWSRELTQWCPKLRFEIYRGDQASRREKRHHILKLIKKRQINIILTTYDYVKSREEDKAFFRGLKLEYCVYDEAHMLKNMKTQVYVNLMQIRSRRKLLLTGTPLQNNITELMSLLNFLMPEIFNFKSSVITKTFLSKDTEQDDYYNQKISQARDIMNPFVLRRLKTVVLKDLPVKSTVVTLCDMTERQKTEYTLIEEKFKQLKDEYYAAKSLSVKDADKQEKEVDLKNIIADGQKRKRKIDRSRQDNWVDSEEGEQEQPEPVVQFNDEELRDAEFDITSLGKCEPNSKAKYAVFFMTSFLNLRKRANHPLLSRVLFTNEKIRCMAEIIIKQSDENTRFDYVVEDMSVMNDFELNELCSCYSGLDEYKLADKEILNSGKFRQLDKLLEKFEKSGDRVLIFSQFQIMLNIMEKYLQIRKYKYLRLDGSTDVAERQGLIDKFHENKDILVFMLTTRAGGVGINLTGANRVIIHDIDLNPQNDKQAEDRCHRVGQQKEVQVYKLISKGTIEEALLNMQINKLQLDADLTSNDDGGTRKIEIRKLFEALEIVD